MNIQTKKLKLMSFITQTSQDSYNLKIYELVNITCTNLYYLQDVEAAFFKNLQVYNTRFIREIKTGFIVDIFGQQKRFRKDTGRSVLQDEDIIRKLAFKRAENYMNKQLTNPENFQLF